MLLSAIAAKLKSRSKDDFKGRHVQHQPVGGRVQHEADLIGQCRTA